MANTSGILELFIDDVLVEKIKVFTYADVEKSVASLKKVYYLDEGDNWEFWLTYKSSMELKNKTE